MKKGQKISDKHKKQISKYQKKNPKKKCKICKAFLKKNGTCNHFHSENHRIYKGYCKNCGKYYEGRGKDYCSRGCVSKVYGYKQIKPTGWKQISKKIYDSNQFKKWKKIVIERDKKCMICGTIKKIESHHLISIFICYYEPFPPLIFNPSNGITLCSSCHGKIECRPKIRRDENSNTLC